MFRSTILILLAVSLSGCISNNSPENTPPEIFSQLDFNANFYLNKDKIEGSENYLPWRFVALQALIEEARFKEANALINSLQNTLSNPKEVTPQLPMQKVLLALLIADKHYAQSDFKDAKEQLAKIDQEQLSGIALNHYLMLYAELQVAYKEYQGAADTLFVLIARLTTDQEVQTYNDLLLEQLSMLPLNVLQEPQTTPYKMGWYALATDYKQYQARPNKLKQAVKLWLAAYPNHELQNHMPNQVINLPEFSPYNPRNIAVLLPLSGRVQRAGQAVQYGISEAFYNQKKHKNKGDIIPQLHFIDTSGVSNEEILEKLKDQNIDFIIGPLIKSNIESLLPNIESTPTIILNAFPEINGKEKSKIVKKTVKALQSKESIPEDVNDSIHFSITLSPEEEAQQAAILMQLKGHKNPLVIAPKNNYGKRVAAAFNAQWKVNHEDSDASSHASIYYFSNSKQFSHLIDGVLLTGKSKQRIQQMKAMMGRNLETEVRSRRDVDAIYIISNRNELILLKPFINTGVSPFASRIPLYANSLSHAADKRKTQNKELAELVFSDNSFLLDDDLKLSPATSRLLKHVSKRDSYKNLRLMALGYDSYQLIYQVMSLKHIKAYSFDGQLGKLTLDENNNIQTQLGWATYTNKGKLIEAIAPTAGK